ncbi:MAG: type I secretion system permease/ATPase [Lentilitoribacter sp.]
MSEPRSLIQKSFKSLTPTYIGVGVLSLIINLLMLTGPLYMLQIYDRVLASGSVPTLMVISVFALGMFAFYGVLDGLRQRILARIGSWLDSKLSGAVFDLSTSLPLALGPEASKIRPLNDLDTIRNFMSGPGPSAMFDIPWLPVYLGIVYLFHPVLGNVALAGVIIIFVLILLKEYVSSKPAKELALASGERQRLIEHGRTNAEAIQAMGMMHALKSRWEDKNGEFLGASQNSSDSGSSFGAFVKTIRMVLQSAMLGIGAYYAILQEISPGVMIAASIMTTRAFAPVEQAIGQWPLFVGSRQARQRLTDLLSMRQSNDEVMDLPVPSEKLVVSKLACGPAGLKKVVVQNISFELFAGDGLGIIGPSGSGKSTLARALVGVTGTARGSVRFDGSKLDQWAMSRWGEIIGYLPQDIQLFDGTVSENISRFSLDADAEKIREAASLANVHDLIAALPDGYNTVIGKSGFAMSAGQQQRLALARAIYNKPFLVVLDEPNSNLDADGEQALTNAIVELRKAGSIVIVIAHRPSAIAAVDKILMVDKGVAKAFGPKAEILAQVVAPVPNQRGA